MKLRTKYIVFVGLLHVVTLVLTFFIFRENIILFIVSEVFIIISVVFAWQLYKELIQPLNFMAQGIDAISDRDFNVKFLPTGKYEMDQLIGVYNTMMDELRKERTVQEEQHMFLEKLMYTSPTGMIILDYDQRVQMINPKALQLLNVEQNDVLGQPVNEWTHPVIQQVKILPSGQSKTCTLSGGVTYKLQKSFFVDRGFPREFVLIEELTAEILEAEKKTYGKVIRMMAHEVNNTIGPVNSILQFTLKSQENGPELENALNIAIERNNNLNAFMRNFADLARLPLPVRKPVDLIRLLNNTTELMQLRAGTKKINFLHKHQDQQMMIDMDALQMEQALINIIRNAIESIEEEGTITLTTHTAPRQLIIQDNGRGIAEASKHHLFSPFYSTKKDGQGVGLIFIREILMNHGFAFSLETVSPESTEFRIIFDSPVVP